MRRYRIVHLTVTDYDQPVRAAHNEVRMSPLNEPGQSTLENRIRIRPITWSHVYRDHWGTHVTAMESLAPHQRLEIEATSTVERTDLPEPASTGGWEALGDPGLVDRSSEWFMDSARTRPGDGLVALAESVRGEPSPRAAAARLGRSGRR